MMAKITIATLILALNGWAYLFIGENDLIPPRQPFAGFPLKLGDWACDRQERMEEKIEAQLGLTDYLLCGYIRSELEPAITTYIGYNEAQMRRGGASRAQSSIHPPEHCLPGAGWDVVQSQRVHVSAAGLPGGAGKVNRLLIAKGQERQLVVYWYHSRGRVISDGYRKILYLFWDRATRRRADGALVRLMIPLKRNEAHAEEQAQRAIDDFLPLLTARLRPYLPE